MADGGLMGTGEVARRLGLHRHRLIQLLDAGHLPDTRIFMAGRRVFREEDVERLRTALARLREGEPAPHNATAD